MSEPMLEAGAPVQAQHLLQALAVRACPVCGSTDDSCERFPERIDAARIDGMSYASRKEPEFMSLRMVVCPSCQLLYAPRVPNAAFLARAYGETGYDSDSEARYAAASYAAALQPWLATLPDRAAALEIGSGNGALLPHLIDADFAEVVGIEPSREAAQSAPPDVRARIRVETFDPARLPAGHFSLVIANQTLEHIDRPLELMHAALLLLKPGGALMVVSHDYRHWLMRLLGRRAPIIDIEHLQLFSRASIGTALARAGFEPPVVRPFRNRYPASYWTRLLPLPAALKRPMLASMHAGCLQPLGAMLLSARVGNMFVWAHKPLSRPKT
ncbi:MAG: class I SAM-dependent methyltransferase [Pseudomonadota bacterium]|nr:class I SAM-dependent methyltransferase [Pseudomonadota bacterium]